MGTFVLFILAIDINIPLVLSVTYTNGDIYSPFTLQVSDDIISYNDKVRFTMQWDGNVVLHSRSSSSGTWIFAGWATNTNFNGRKGDTITLQNNGELVVLDHPGAILWTSNSTAGTAPFRLIVSDDVAVYILDLFNTIIWSTNPSFATLDTIWFDTFDTNNGWFLRGNITLPSNSTNCPNHPDNCVEIKIPRNSSNKVNKYIERTTAISTYSAIQFQVDMRGNGLEVDEYCEIWWVFDSDDWIQYNTTYQNDVYKDVIADIPLPKSYTHISISVGVKGDHYTDICFYDNAILRGTQGPTGAPTNNPTKSSTLPTSATTKRPTFSPTPLCNTIAVEIIKSDEIIAEDFNGLYTINTNERPFDRPIWNTEDGFSIEYNVDQWMIYGDYNNTLSYLTNNRFPPLTMSFWESSEVLLNCIATYSPTDVFGDFATTEPSSEETPSPTVMYSTDSKTSSPTQNARQNTKAADNVWNNTAFLVIGVTLIVNSVFGLLVLAFMICRRRKRLNVSVQRIISVSVDSKAQSNIQPLRQRQVQQQNIAVVRLQSESQKCDECGTISKKKQIEMEGKSFVCMLCKSFDDNDVNKEVNKIGSGTSKRDVHHGNVTLDAMRNDKIALGIISTEKVGTDAMQTDQ